MSLGEIIRNKREELGLTLDEVSIKVKFSKPYLSTIETGRVNNPPSDELLQKLERVLGFVQGSLLYMAHLESAPTDVRQKYEEAIAQNKQYREFIKQIQEQGHGGSIPVIKEESQETFSAGRLVPIINKVMAGYPADFDDLDYPVGIADDYIRCPDVHDPNAFAVYVVGDSMEPKFKEGDIVVFSPKIQAQNGDDCFVRFATPHETTFKRVYFEDNNYRLQPRNEKYAPIVVESKRVNGLYKAIAKVERL